MCRAVVITGLPFAPIQDPKVKMKREFLDQNRAKQNAASIEDGGFGVQRAKSVSLSGQEWYSQQAHRAVNQAIGRVIRNKNDYGAVLLLDSRFSLPNNQQGLSSWVRPHILPDEGIGQAISSLVKFYKQAANSTQRRELETPPKQNDISVILQYEDETKTSRKNIPSEDEVTKVAIIQKPNSNKDRNTERQLASHEDEDDFANRSYVPPERIVARLDMKALDSQTHSNVSKLQEGLQEKENGFSPTASQPEPWEQKPNSRTSEARADFRKTAETSDSKNVEQTAAKEFFHRVRSQMSVPEFSSIRKAVVSMKQFTDPKHRKAFLNAVRKISSIILLYETFESRSTVNKPELLSLFFQLLPTHFLSDSQRWTMYLVLKESKFGKIVEDSSTSNECKKVVSLASDLLWEVWFGSASYAGQTTFLRRFEKILIPIQSDKKIRSECLPSFISLLPLEYQATANALIADLKATKKIEQIKEREKKPHGESSEQSRSAVSQKGFGESKQPRKEGPDRTNIPNPYKRQVGVEQNNLKGSASRMLESGDNSKNPFQRAIKQSESSIFTGKATSTSSAVECNAPKNLTCALCTQTYKKVSNI